MASLYDEVEYPGYPFAQTHPDRLATMAALCGLTYAAVETCRVLELGCGDGGNLIPMALTLPNSRFTGIDLAEKAVGQGRRVISALGLRNIELHAGDLLSVTPSWGEFDYIITHGLYSWTPAPVREQIMRISKENLSPDGVAFVSYNALPGGRIRQMLREMMLFQVEDIADPVEKAGQARALLNFVATGRKQPGVFQELVGEEAERMQTREAWALFHDELGGSYEPFYFHQFMEHAGQHGLQYLAEADIFDMHEGTMTSEAVGVLDAIAGDDRVLREQYVDFAKGRRFRQTLLCHEGRQVNFPPKVERLEGLYASTTASRIADNEFQGLNGARIKTNHAEAIEMLNILVEAAPQVIAVRHLEVDPQLILATALSGMIDLHTMPRPLVTKPGPMPKVSALARYQISQGLPVATLHHATVHLEDETDRELVALLDGTRPRSALMQIDDLEGRLIRLGKMGVLVG